MPFLIKDSPHHSDKNNVKYDMLWGKAKPAKMSTLSGMV